MVSREQLEREVQQGQGGGGFERRVESKEGEGQKWQVEPKDIRLMVEENLLGRRKVTYEEYALIPKTVGGGEQVEAKATFWEKENRSVEELKKKAKEVCEDSKIFWDKVDVVTTGRSQKKMEVVKEPLMNETGAYHCLGIIEGIFSRMGYLSNLSGNEINDIIYHDVLVPLLDSIMKNHEKYGITKGSRDEIVGFFQSTVQLILNASREGWTGNRFAKSVQEQIVTNKGDEGSGGFIKKILG